MRCPVTENETQMAYHSLEIGVRRFGGVRACRVVDAPHSSIGEHAHDWPVLSIYVAGGLKNTTEAGACSIESPWVVLYGAGASHSNRVGPRGFEQLEIEFDPDWLKLAAATDLRGVTHCIGGPVCLSARRLAQLWLHGNQGERLLMDATRAFVATALAAKSVGRPAWLASALTRVQSRPGTTAAQLASELGLNPHWLAQAYRVATGEGIRETARRTRVERAATLLRSTDLSAADIAAAAGFCDQSHMIRCFLQVLGRTPSQVENEWRQVHNSSIAPPQMDSEAPQLQIMAAERRACRR